MSELYFKYALYGLASLFLVSVGGNAWTVYKMQRMDATIQDQIAGVLSENATKITTMNETLGTVKSQMVDRATLEQRAKEIISGLDQKTQDAIGKYTSETGAKVDSISKRFVRMETRLDQGISRIGKKVDRQRKTPPPPKSWKGVSRQDQTRCADHPERCETFEFSWHSPFSLKGRPIYTFSSRNIWEGKGSLDLNLAFKVVAITYGEDQSKLGSGAVQNQGMHIYGGYFDEQGEFVEIEGLESKLMKGDKNLDPRLIYVPKVDAPIGRLGLSLFEPSLLVGSTYQAGDFGLSIGGSFLNLRKGEYRLGGNFALTESNQYLGLMGTWHPYIAGKNLNIAPGLGWVLGADGSNTWSLGVHFQVW